VTHEPEIYLSFLTEAELFGVAARAVSIGFTHQSNGRSGPLSRSWNRVFADAQLVRGDLGVSLRAWSRVEEDAEDDDNPDIEDFLGHYEVRTSWRKNDHLFSLMLRNVFDSEHRYGAEFSWSFPISGRLRGLVQWYNGYGENLIDYNHKNNRIGVGVLISDWL
jgi:phospholipase A1